MTAQQEGSRAPVLAAFDPGSAAREPLEFGLAAAERTGSRLIIVAVHHSGPFVSTMGGDVEGVPDEQRTMEHLRLGLQRRGLRDVQVKVVNARTVAGGLKRAVEELNPELVVVGSQHKGRLGSVLMGTTAEEIIHDATCPVAVVPKGYERPESGVMSVGAAFAESDEGAETLRAAADLARGLGVRLKAITVVDRKHADDSGEATAQQLADTEARAREVLGARAEGLDLEADVRVGDPADGLVEASQSVDVLVMASSGRGSRRAALLGSASRDVAGHAACPVLILRKGTTEATEALIGNVEPTGTS
jgi:nucleotide-binding universal stress UspA family protein